MAVNNKILYDTLDIKGDVNVNMPEKVYNQIKYLTDKISAVEWSGVMFYSVEGDINDRSTFKINLEEIFLMDKGNGASTEFLFDESVIQYIMEKEERLDWKIGLIHSHNSMGVFFSGTDMDELKENAPKHNYYFSLIVNNKLEFKAKVALYGKIENHSSCFDYKCKNSKGEDFLLKLISDKKDTIFIFDCIINTPKEVLNVEEYFSKRVSEIINKKIPVVHISKEPYINWGDNDRKGKWNYRTEQFDDDSVDDQLTLKFDNALKDDKTEKFLHFLLRKGIPLSKKSKAFPKSEKNVNDSLVLTIDEIWYECSYQFQYEKIFNKALKNFDQSFMEFNNVKTYKLSDLEKALADVQKFVEDLMIQNKGYKFKFLEYFLECAETVETKIKNYSLIDSYNK